MNAVRILTQVAQLDPWFDRANPRAVMIFKHSLICPISAAAHGEFERFVRARAGRPGLELALIEIQNTRPISDAVATRTGVKHESPQALLVRGGEVLWHASHAAIKVSSLEGAVTQHLGG